MKRIYLLLLLLSFYGEVSIAHSQPGAIAPAAPTVVNDAVVVAPLKAVLKEGTNEALFKAQVSIQLQKRQIPRADGMTLQVDVLNPSDKDFSLRYFLDQLDIPMLDESLKVVLLPNVRSRLRIRGLLAVQPTHVEEPLVTPFKIFSAKINERVLDDKELNSENIVIPAHNQLNALLGIDRVSMRVLPTPPIAPNAGNPQPALWKEIPLPPGIYRMIPRVGLDDSQSPTRVKFTIDTADKKNQLIVDYTNAADKK